MVDSWTPGVTSTLVKSPYYYKRGAIYLDKIVFKVLANVQTELTALQAGDIQVMQTSSMPPPTSPNLTVIKGATLGCGGLVINIGNKNGVGNLPYSNVGSRSRRARSSGRRSRRRSTEARTRGSPTNGSRSRSAR